ncbi:MAG: carboxymuconolactone decarboxylase family protein [Betaproteobacteria bacterium]|nr:carboxymuconolactone decarboxylase family protein [Betaproteobacteria bacterium]
MQRYTLVEYDQATPEVRAIYDDILHNIDSATVPNWAKSLGSNAALLKAYWERTKGSLLYGSIPTILKEMIIFAVSVENGSRYCSACHAHAVLNMDKTLKFDDLFALVGKQDTRLALPQPYRAAIQFATQVARDPNSVTDQAFDNLRAADFTDNEIRELLSVIDLAMMFNSYTSTLRLPLDPQYKPVLAESEH